VVHRPRHGRRKTKKDVSRDPRRSQYRSKKRARRGSMQRVDPRPDQRICNAAAAKITLSHLSMPSEANTCRRFVLPKLYSAGWIDDQISEQRTFTDGRIMVSGKKTWRRPQKRADYLLRYPLPTGLEHGTPVVVVEGRPRAALTIARDTRAAATGACAPGRSIAAAGSNCEANGCRLDGTYSPK
jgi:hypothetical protein